MAASVETKKDIAKRSVSAAKYTVVFRVLSQATSLVVTVLLVRALSEHDYGIYNLFYSVICLLGMVASFGLANTLQRYIPEYYSKGEFRIANNLYRIASIIRLLSSGNINSHLIHLHKPLHGRKCTFLLRVKVGRLG